MSAHLPFLEALGAPPDDALAARRMDAHRRFAGSGFPTRRHEAWKFTELKPLIEARFAPAGGGAVGTVAALPGADTMAFANGRFDTSRSSIGALPDGVVLCSFADWLKRDIEAAAAAFVETDGAEQAFLALNAAFAADGVVLIVPDGIRLERPIRIAHVQTGAAATQLKHVIRLGRNAQAGVVESFAGEGASWTNVSVSVELGDGARLSHTKLQGESEAAFHIAHLAVALGAGAKYDGFVLTLGARLAREDVRAELLGADARCGYSGAYLLSGRQEAAVNSLIRHAAPGGRTREVFKGCVDDRAQGVFQGKIRVEQAAQKTDAHQLNKTMLLGDRAVMDSKPELEIHADDVKCSHGATIGDLDETQLFYLRSRGIPPATARDMLIEAFVADAVELVEDAGVRAWLLAALQAKLRAGRR
jgi:Fe-S cluster assembly protein SufD